MLADRPARRALPLLVTLLSMGSADSAAAAGEARAPGGSAGARADAGTPARAASSGALRPAPIPASAREPARLQTEAAVAPARVEVARAFPLPPPSAAVPGPGPAPAPASPLAEPIRPRREGLEIQVGGSLYVGVGADERQGWGRDLALDRARIEVRGSMPGLLTVIEADVADPRPLKDAFVRLDGPATTRLTAGRFKAPFLERETASSWRLPLVTRGVVNDYLSDRNELGGRRIGAVGEVRPWAGALELSAGVFQGTASGDEKPPQDYVARAALRVVRGVEVGAAGYQAGRSGPDASRRQAGSAFASLDAGPLALSVEAVAGRVEQGSFTAGLGLVEYTVRLGKAFRVTPVAGVEALRLRAPAAGTGSGAVAGAVLGFGQGLKLKVQGERARRPGETAPANAIAVQLATRF